MYAIIRVGGHQEKVQPGERVVIDRIKTDVGGTVELHPLMVATDDGTAVSDPGELKEKAGVLGTVVEHIKGEKVDVFQYRGKTGFRRHIGARQALTVVEIAEIRFGDQRVSGEEAKTAATEKREAELREREEKREAAQAAREEAKAKRTAARTATAAKAPAKKTAAKKASGAKKTAAKKAASKKKS